MPTDWKSAIANAKAVPVVPVEKPKGYHLKGYWEKGSKETTWVAVILGLSDKYGFEREFVESHAIEWIGEKGKGKPAGIKSWYLPDGLFSIQLAEKKGAKAERFFAAIDGDTLTKLEEEQLRSIFDSGVALPPPPPTKARTDTPDDDDYPLNEEGEPHA